MLTSQHYAQKASGKPDATVMQEREVSAQNTQADRKESLRSHSSEGQKALGKPNALISSEQGNLIRSSVFRNADQSNLRGSLLEGNKDHLLNQARSDLAKQELHVESLNKCIGELQGQTEEQRLAPQDAQYGFVESRREQVRLQEELSMKEKVLRNTQIRNMHEMGEIKRAQEQRIDEVSVQKSRENLETIQHLTSQLQQMQEQMNSMNDSGDFPDVESNYSGRLSHVSSQPVMIPSSRSLLSREKRLPLDTWNQSGLQENVFGNQFSTFDSPRGHPQRIQSDNVQRNREAVPEARRTKTVHTSEDRLNHGTIPMPTFVWKIRCKTQATICSDFPSDAVLWIEEVEMVASLDELKSSRSVCGKDFQNFEMLDAKIASALNKIIQNSQFKKKVSLEEQKAQKEDRFLRGRQIAFMIYDYFRVTGAHDTVLYYADLFSFTLHDDNIQELDTRWDEVLLSMSEIPSNDILESLYKMRICESAQLKTVLELCDMEYHQKISVHNDKKLKIMEKRSIDQKLRLRNFDDRDGRIGSGAVLKSRKGFVGVEGGKGICFQWKETGQCSQGDRCSSRHETQDRAQKPEHTATTF